MNTLKIGHIADCHLCNRQYGYESRGNDFLKGLLNAIDALNAAGARLVLCSGDLIDTVNPGSKVCLTQLSAVREKLRSNGQLMIVTAGNHDSASPHWCSAMHDTQDSGGIYFLEDGLYIHTSGVTIAGCGYKCMSDYLEWMEQAPEADILMFHGEVVEGAKYGGHEMLTVRNFYDTGKWKVVAAGHIHIRDTYRIGDFAFTYPGSTELCDASEDPAKSANLIVMEDNGSGWKLGYVDSVPFKTRNVQYFSVDSEESLLKACEDVVPGSVVHVRFDRSVKSVYSMLKAAADRKAAESGHTGMQTIVRTRPLPTKDEQAILDRPADSRGMSIAEYAEAEVPGMFGEEERERGLESLCIALLNPATDHRVVIERYIAEQLNGEIIV